MDYSQFRQGSAEGAAVSVNHRALITRALTKYPVDYALFRELLQNSADAQAKKATIQFETPGRDKNVSQIHQLPVNRLKFSNDGLDFAVDDWNRLREIASGNPNETKIGAFGVGFYSVFELTEEPLVHSGDKIMNFRYKGVQLHFYFTEKAPCYQKGTLIDLPYRKEGELPDLVKFIGFLVQSFMLVPLMEINLEIKYGDGSVVNLLNLTKTVEKPRVLSPPAEYQSRSPQKMLKMAHIQQSAVRVSLKYLNATQMPPLTMSKGFFSFGKQLVSSLVTTSGNPDEYTLVTCDLTKVDAFVDVSVTSSYRNQMMETLLKPPPKQAVMSLLSFNGSLPSKDISDQLKAYVFPKNYNDAKIFIGFPTKQSTGLKSHLALNQIIPTMERTAVDMSNQFVKDWNCEMLYMAGVMARCAYENELYLCQSQKSGQNEAEFVVSRFKFSPSAPDAVIGLYIREGFWKCSKRTLVPTTQGVLPNTQARLASEASKFLRTTPVVTNTELATELQKLGLVHEVSLSEIAGDVGNSPVNIEFSKTYIRWLSERWPNMDMTSRVMLLSAIRIEVAHKQVIEMGSSQWYHDRSKLPDDEVAQSLPPNCLPAEISSKLGLSELSALGLRPLSIEYWVKHRFDALNDPINKNNGSGASIASGVLLVTSKAWSRLAYNTRTSMRTALESVPCIPTQNGLRLPSESYVKEIKIFPHLPVVSPKLELPLSWLRDIGLRESIDMSFVLKALSGNELKWTNEDLVTYLEENSDALKDSDWKVLLEGRFFSKVGESKSLFKASELYAPSDELRRLGLPIISFNNWGGSSKQADLLFAIGLNKFPSPEHLFANVRSSSESQVALRYFVRNYEDAKYSYRQIANLEVVPTASGDGKLSKPSACYRDIELLAFGEKVLDPKWEPAAARLGVRKRPNLTSLLERVLMNPPLFLSNSSQCDGIFSYFAQHAGDFGDSDIKMCQQAAFIPVKTKAGSISWEKPTSVFLPHESLEQGDEDIMRPLLVTIHPSRKALPFFYLIGVSDRPTLTQMIEMILDDPRRVFELLRSGDIYEEILTRIENKWSSVSQRSDLVQKMKSAPFLLGVKYNPHSFKEKAEPKGEVSLYSATDLSIVDDISIFNQFKNKIVTAPQVDSLEKLYGRLGVPKLSEILRESIKIGPRIVDDTQRVSIERRIRERLQLFIENTSKQVNPKFKNVDIVLVKSLEINRQLPPHSSITILSSACVNPNIPNELLIVPGRNFDWIDVASALSKLVLIRPDQDSVVVLEIQLSSDLAALERKGYNVERIRRKNGLSDMEKKLPALKIRDEPSVGITGPREPPQNNSSTGTQHQQRQQPQPQAQSQAQQPQQAYTRPPPSLPQQAQQHQQQHYQQQLQQQQRSQQQKKFSDLNGTQPARPGFLNKLQTFKEAISGTVSNQKSGTVDVQNQLKQGLRKAQAFNGSQISTPQNVDAPAPMRESDCVSPQKIHELQYVSTTENDMKIYATAVRPNPGQDELLLSEALRVLCGVFNYPLPAVNIYRDADTKSIAFNYNGSLFFNSCVVPDTQSILDYYYPVMAHELAHNLVSSHGASHSFYSESYMQSTLSNFTSAVQ